MMNNRRWFRHRATAVATSLRFKIITLVITSGVSFAGSIVALQRDDFWPWVVAMVAVLLLEALYLSALGINSQRRAAEFKQVMHRATVARMARNATPSPNVPSLTD